MQQKLMKKLLLFLAINMAIFMVCEVALRANARDMFHHERFLELSVRNFEKRASDIDMLFLGDSRVYYGVNPDGIHAGDYKAHNFAYPLEPSQTTYYKLKYYLDRNMLPDLDMVLLQLRYDELPGRINQKGKYQLMLSHNYYRFYRFGEILRNNGPKKALMAFLNGNSYVIRLHKDIFKAVSAGWSVREKLQENGYSRRDYYNSGRNFDEEETERVLRIESKEWLELAEAALESDHNKNGLFYTKMVKMLKSRGVKVFFLHIPEYWETEGFSERLDVKLAEMAQKFVPGTPVWSYDYDHKIWDDIKLFSDIGHLNHDGSEVLGELITEDLISWMEDEENDNRKAHVGMK